MNAIKLPMLVVVFLAVIAVMGSARAQQDSKPDSGATMGQQPGSGSMMGHGTMGDGQSMMGHGGMMSGMMGGMGMKDAGSSMCGRMTAHIEGRLAFLKAELSITPAQESLWNDYASAVRDNAKAMGTRCSSLMGEGGTSEKSLPDRLDAQEQFVAARLDALRGTSKALKALYAALSDAQKQTANELIRSSTGMM